MRKKTMIFVSLLSRGLKYVYRDANHSDFCGILPIFKANFRIMILNVKIMANDKLKMVPDKITGVTPTSTPVIPGADLI